MNRAGGFLPLSGRGKFNRPRALGVRGAGSRRGLKTSFFDRFLPSFLSFFPSAEGRGGGGGGGAGSGRWRPVGERGVGSREMRCRSNVFMLSCLSLLLRPRPKASAWNSRPGIHPFLKLIDFIRELQIETRRGGFEMSKKSCKRKKGVG